MPMDYEDVINRAGAGNCATIKNKLRLIWRIVTDRGVVSQCYFEGNNKLVAGHKGVYISNCTVDRKEYQ